MRRLRRLPNGGADLQVERLAHRAARKQRHDGEHLLVRNYRFAAGNCDDAEKAAVEAQ